MPSALLVRNLLDLWRTLVEYLMVHKIESDSEDRYCMRH